MLHDAVFCSKPCYRPRSGCSHTCEKECGLPCDPQCMVLIEDVNVQMECRHIHKSLRCFEYQDPSKVQCQVPVTWTVPGCEHQVKEPCSTDVYSDDYKCKAMCSAILPCGHVCQRFCWECRTRLDGVVVNTHHPKCSTKCLRPFTCQHRCEATCHGEEDCPPCAAKCQASCIHSACSKTCSEPCKFARSTCFG